MFSIKFKAADFSAANTTSSCKSWFLTPLVLSSIALSTAAIAVPYQAMDFSWDKALSSDMGANLSLSALNLYEYLDDSALPSTKADTSALAIFGRLLKSIAFDANIGRMSSLVQHEVFGHGYKVREFGLPVTGYKLNFWPHGSETFFDPFSGPSGSTRYRISLSAHPIYNSVISAAGVEANAQLAEKMRFRFENQKYMDARDFFTYYQNSLSLYHYINLTSGRYERNPNLYKDFLDGHDIYSYIDSVNDTYALFGKKNELTPGKVRKRAWLELLDPYLWYQSYAYAEYVFNGETRFDYPKIGTENFNFLPMLRLNLAPYGLEHQLDTYFTFNEQKFSTHLRYNNNSIKPSYGVGLRLPNIYSYQDWSFSPYVAYWQQKAIFDHGALFTVTTNKKIAKEFFGFLELGGKSGGYIPGYNIKPDGIAKIGLRLQF